MAEASTTSLKTPKSDNPIIARALLDHLSRFPVPARLFICMLCNLLLTAQAQSDVRRPWGFFVQVHQYHVSGRVSLAAVYSYCGLRVTFVDVDNEPDVLYVSRIFLWTEVPITLRMVSMKNPEKDGRAVV
jgi:hypothetical protein